MTATWLDHMTPVGSSCPLLWLGAARAISLDVRCGHPALRSLGAGLAPPSWLRSASNAARLARATPRGLTLGSAGLRRTRRHSSAGGVVVAWVSLVAAIFSAGCGGPVRRAVAGAVTLDGRPLDEAVILFVPIDAGGRKSGGPIVAGRYEVREDVGLPPGRYRVEIADDPPIDPAMRPGQIKPQPRRNLPVVYSTSSPLAIEVTADGAADFSFDLSSKPSPTP